MDSNIDIATAMAQVYPAMFSPGSQLRDPTADEAGGIQGYGGGTGKVLGIREQAKRLGHRVKISTTITINSGFFFITVQGQN